MKNESVRIESCDMKKNPLVKVVLYIQSFKKKNVVVSLLSFFYSDRRKNGKYLVHRDPK
jgi:hypothetical protein